MTEELIRFELQRVKLDRNKSYRNHVRYNTEQSSITSNKQPKSNNFAILFILLLLVALFSALVDSYNIILLIGFFLGIGIAFVTKDTEDGTDSIFWGVIIIILSSVAITRFLVSGADVGDVAYRDAPSVSIVPKMIVQTIIAFFTYGIGFVFGQIFLLMFSVSQIDKQEHDSSHIYVTSTTVKRETNCKICKQSLYGENYALTTACRHCTTQFHMKHLVEWIRMKKSCPLCKKGLRIGELLY
ncbi:MAG: hypothetical protein ACW99Q_20245 [Candidatus Kariarchaeaceae archaeon]|jgi:hypothetical protein